MVKTNNLILLLSIFLFAACQTQPPTLLLFQNGQSKYQIEYEDSDSNVEAATQELKTLL